MQTRSSLLLVCALVTLVLYNRVALADTVTWIGAGANANWSTPANWDSNPSLPAATDDVLIGTGWTSGSVNVGGSADSPVVVNSLALQNNSAVDRTIGGYLQLTSGVVTYPTIASSRTIVFGGNLYLPAGTNNWFLAANNTIWFSSNIAPIGGFGALTIVKTGAGMLVFSGANLQYNGDWDYTGDFRIVSNNSLGSGTFTWRGGGVWAMSLSSVIANNIVFDTGWSILHPNGNTLTFSGALTNLGSSVLIAFNGRDSGSQSSTTILSGTNVMTSTATYVIPLGVLRLDAPGMLRPVSKVTFGWNTLGWGNIIWNVAETTTNGFSNQAAKNGVPRLTMNTNGTTTLTGQYSLNSSSSDSNGASLELSAVSGGTLALTGLVTDQKDLSGTLLSGVTARSVTKIGDGTVILSNGRNEYMGGTIISNGTLLVQNATGTATGTNRVQVLSGGTLGGTGRVAGAVSLLPGARLAPGGANSVGTLTVSNSVTFASGSTNQVDIQAEGSDTLSMTGALQLNGATLEAVLPAGVTVAPGTVYTIATGFTSLDSSGFAGLPEGAVVNAGGTALTIHYNTTASPKTITLKRHAGTLISIQ